MTNKYLTVLVVPHDERNVRRLRLSYRWLKGFAALAGAIVLLAVLGVVTYGRLAARASQAALLERENARLVEENAKVGEIASNLERSERAFEQIREMAGLSGTAGTAGAAGGVPVELAAATDGTPVSGAGIPAVAGALVVPEETELPPPARARYAMVPSGWPLTIKGFVTARYTGNAGHPGVDIAVPTNTPVTATAEGTVRVAGTDPVYGRYLVLGHTGGLETMYAHNARLLVARGAHVKRGDPIAFSGNSGRSSAPHLHYEVRQSGSAVDPAPYLR